MAATQKLTIRNVFADDSTLTVTVNNINPEVGINPRAKFIVQDFNDSKGGSLTTKLKSKTGANWVGIDKMTVTTTDRQYIF